MTIFPLKAKKVKLSVRDFLVFLKKTKYNKVTVMPFGGKK